MTPAAALSNVIGPALALLPSVMDSPEARVLLVGISLQESELKERRQLVGSPPRPIGPAKGLWQFEAYGGCRGVIQHAASRYWMHSVCTARGVQFAATALWNAIEHDDVLAAATARLLLFTDPRRLPSLGDEQGAWHLYIRTWRPGRPHPHTWPDNYAKALAAVARSTR